MFDSFLFYVFSVYKALVQSAVFYGLEHLSTVCLPLKNAEDIHSVTDIGSSLSRYVHVLSLWQSAWNEENHETRWSICEKSC